MKYEIINTKYEILNIRYKREICDEMHFAFPPAKIHNHLESQDISPVFFYLSPTFLWQRVSEEPGASACAAWCNCLRSMVHQFEDLALTA